MRLPRERPAARADEPAPHRAAAREAPARGAAQTRAEAGPEHHRRADDRARAPELVRRRGLEGPAATRAAPEPGDQAAARESRGQRPERARLAGRRSPRTRRPTRDRRRRRRRCARRGSARRRAPAGCGRPRRCDRRGRRCRRCRSLPRRRCARRRRGRAAADGRNARRARRHPGRVARALVARSGLGAVDEHAQRGGRRRDRWRPPRADRRRCASRRPAAAPPGATAGGLSSRTVTTEPKMETPANGTPWSLAVRQPASRKHEAA